MRTILRKLRDSFFNPALTQVKHPAIHLDSSAVILQSSRFDFRIPANLFKGQLRIGANTMTGAEFIFESDRGEIVIGKNTFINSGTKFISRSSIHVGDFVTIAWGCTFYDHNSHSLDFRERQNDIEQQLKDYRSKTSFISGKNWASVKSLPIRVEDNAWIGFDCVILAGVTIGEGAIVGAKSVVRENVEPWTIAYGNPAKMVKKLK